MFRQKDLVGWWNNPHVERVAGIEMAATTFVPGSKPIWLTEIGIPAVDKGANAPNVFPDSKSAESGYPHFSSGARDDLVQARGLEAIISGFDPARDGFDAVRNPVHPVTGIRMVDPANIFVWSYDARPFPAFPDLGGIWADGASYDTGHWLNGRIEGTPVDRLLRRVLTDFGLPAADTVSVDGFLDGYVLDRPMSARQAIEPLGQIFGFDATMVSGRLDFRGRAGAVARSLTTDDLVLDDDGRPFELRRSQESELPLELRLGFSDGEGDYRASAARSRRLAGAARREVGLETAIVTRPAEGQRLADQRLQEVWAGRETLQVELSPRCLGLEPGDVVALQVDGDERLFRLTRIEDGPSRKASGRAVEPAIYRGGGVPSLPRPSKSAPALPGRPMAVPLVLPIARTQPPPLLSLAAFASPWPGALAVWQADGMGQFDLLRLVEVPSIVGETLTALPAGPIWRSDTRAVVDVRLRGGILSSIAPEAALSGGNALALLDETGAVEIVTVAHVELIGPQRFRLSGLIRGIGGSEEQARRSLPIGARVVVLDGAPVALTSDIGDLGQVRRYRVGPAGRDVGDPTMAELTASAGIAALRPLSPVHPRVRRGQGGLAIDWIRRTRIDGDSWDLAEIPLGEETESYDITILDGEVAMRHARTNAAEWIYPEAFELADFGGAQREIEIVIAQISAVAGRGQEWRGRVPVR